MNIEDVVKSIHILAVNLETSISAIAHTLESKNIIKPIDRKRIIDFYNNIYYPSLCEKQVDAIIAESGIKKSEEVDLKDCPFCGGKAIRVQHPGTNWDGKKPNHVNVGALHGLWYVGCPSEFFEGLAPHCDVHPSACWYADLAEAERVWNKQK